MRSSGVGEGGEAGARPAPHPRPVADLVPGAPAAAAPSPDAAGHVEGVT